MRALTLNEKITLKGILRFYGVPRMELVGLDMRGALHFWRCLTNSSIADYGKYTGLRS